MKVSPTKAHGSRLLQEHELGPEDSSCRICGEKSRTIVATLQHDPRVALLRCPTCRVDSAARMPTEETLASYYQDYFVEDTSVEQDDHVTFHIAERLATHILKGLEIPAETAKFRILDFGGGDGSVSTAIARQVINAGVQQAYVAVVDVHDQLVSVDDERIVVEKVVDLERLAGDAFDLVIASAVLEHIPDPRAIIETLFACVRPGGFLYARTPTITPLMQLCSRFGIQLDFTFPGHVHDMGQCFWERLLPTLGMAANFQIVRSKPSIVATTFQRRFWATAAAYLLKLPWYLLGRCYGLVGGWEVLCVRCRPAGP